MPVLLLFGGNLTWRRLLSRGVRPPRNEECCGVASKGNQRRKRRSSGVGVIVCRPKTKAALPEQGRTPLGLGQTAEQVEAMIA